MYLLSGFALFYCRVLSLYAQKGQRPFPPGALALLAASHFVSFVCKNSFDATRTLKSKLC